MLLLRIARKIRCGAVKTLFNLSYGSRFTMGKGCTFRAGFKVSMQNDGTGNVTIGDGCFFNNYCSINCLNSIEIGKGCLFGEGVRIYDHDHAFDESSVFGDKFVSAPVRIGDKCWFGSNVVVLKGVTIGDNVIIAAGTVVAKDVPSNTIVRDRLDIVFSSRVKE